MLYYFILYYIILYYIILYYISIVLKVAPQVTSGGAYNCVKGAFRRAGFDPTQARLYYNYKIM